MVGWLTRLNGTSNTNHAFAGNESAAICCSLRSQFTNTMNDRHSTSLNATTHGREQPLQKKQKNTLLQYSLNISSSTVASFHDCKAALNTRP